MKSCYFFISKSIILLLFTLFINLNLFSQSIYLKDGKITSSDTVNRKDKNGLKQGTWVFELKSGIVKVEGYINDTLEGTMKIFRLVDAKLLHEEQYLNGKRNGHYIDYDEKDSIELIQHYKNNKLHGNIKWYYKSKLMEDMNYKNGKKDGVSKLYNANGNLSSMITFKNGEKDGISKLYNDNGNQSSMLTYKNGKLKGTYKYYYKNGQLSSEGDSHNLAPDKFYTKNGILKEMRLYDKTGKYIKTIYYKENGEIKKEKVLKKLKD